MGPPPLPWVAMPGLDSLSTTRLANIQPKLPLGSREALSLPWVSQWLPEQLRLQHESGCVFCPGFLLSCLEGARFREKSQLLYLLDAVQNGIRQPNLRFTFSLALCIACVAEQILKPGDKRENKSCSQEKRKLLPLQLVNEFLYVLVTLIKCIRTNVDLAKLAEFFSPLSSVLEYRAVVAEAFREMRRFTVNDSVLSSRELLLLHKWSLICRDLQLQEDLQALAQKYQNKELLKNIKDKNKPQASSHVYRHIQKKNEVEEDDAAADVEVSQLEKCREHLNSILAHWDPVFLAPPSPQGGETLRAGEPGGEAVADICASTPVVGSTSAGLSRELGVLSSIMLQLLEEQGLASTFHKLVKSLRLSMQTGQCVLASNPQRFMELAQLLLKPKLELAQLYPYQKPEFWLGY
ncbi:hypothetical protein DUI87_30311 [Hirundo rustica rustica]|uniref:Uncharacterized protein n=1 Tax=Hirundo rustica rustica TaxID=333673 RepID=A0A3M0J305_HIRRU|nr:hypothetical protein DUI87_30311 [Hirundo rustica rustica]